MRIQRIYYPDQLSVDSTVILDSRNYHYLLNILRFREGHKIILFNGDGNNYSGRITRIQKNRLKQPVIQKKRGKLSHLCLLNWAKEYPAVKKLITLFKKRWSSVSTALYR